MALKAVRDTIIISIEYDETSKGGIVIPEVAKQYHGNFWGRVIAIGPECKYDLKPGNKVYYRRFEGFKIRHEGKDFLCLQAKWILAKEV